MALPLFKLVCVLSLLSLSSAQDPAAAAALGVGAAGADPAAGGAAAAAAADPAAVVGAPAPGYAPGFTGLWEMQQVNAGVSAMHLQIMPNTNMALMYDTGVLGPSIINLTPAQGCRKIFEPPGSPDDCTAHAVEYNTNTGAVRPLKIGTDFWCSSGGLTVEGSLISIGGTLDGGRAVRYLDPCPDCEFRDTPNVVAEPRWYATQAQLPDNRYFVIGGRASFSYEYVGPEGQINAQATFSQFIKDTTDRDENNLYPHVHLSTDGNLFIFANDRSIIFNPNTNTIVRELPVLAGGARCYPASGSSVLMPLRLNTNAAPGGPIPAQVMICGGGPKESYAEAAKGNFLPALDDCNTIDVSNPAGAWVKEIMPSPRTMGDMLLLPNTEVLLINGAKRGCSAWELAEDPNFVPTMYSLDRPDGQRFMELAPALIARMYHSSSALLIDGKILVAGSNTHDRYKFDVKYPTEVRVEKFSPPYLNPALKDSQPQIQAQGTDIKLAYGQPFKVTCTAVAPLLRENIKVTMYAPVFTTHGCNMNQRLLILAVTDFVADPAGPSVMTVLAPATPVLAPAGYYMLFVNNGVVPSTGVWVQIKHENGVKWVCQRLDERRVNQNSGVMIEAIDKTYYGVLLDVCVLKYPQSLHVVVFKCRWYDESRLRHDRELTSVNTTTNCHMENPLCLALKAKQVFYVEDPRSGRGWKVVNFVSQRGCYNPKTLARSTDQSPTYEINEPYQEPYTNRIEIDRPGGITIDLSGFQFPSFVPPVQVADIPPDIEEYSSSESDNSDMEGHEDYVSD